MSSDYLFFKPLLDENGKPVVRRAEYEELYWDEGCIRTCRHHQGTTNTHPIYTRVTDGWLMEESEGTETPTHVALIAGEIIPTDLWLSLKHSGSPKRYLRITPITSEPSKPKSVAEWAVKHNVADRPVSSAALAELDAIVREQQPDPSKRERAIERVRKLVHMPKYFAEQIVDAYEAAMKEAGE